MAEKEGVSIEMDEREKDIETSETDPMVQQEVPQPPPKPSSHGLHPAVYVTAWISMSSAVIIFNKWVLSSAGFSYPIILTTWHLVFATILTQLMARFTKTLDSRKKVPMTGKVYVRAILPIGFMFSLSLICSNLTYLYLTVAFIQMLKATTPVAVLLVSWGMGLAPPSMKTLGNVSVIVLGVVIASYGEMVFIVTGVIFQLCGVLFEATRLVMVQKLLSSAEFKMDPLVSLYYFAPACAVMNGIVAAVIELPKFKMADLHSLGPFILIANAAVAFLLNVSVVFLIGKTSSLTMTLCGVLKDILLVLISIIFFKDDVTALQAFGYTIALGGLVYYKLGGEKIKEHALQARRAWGEYGARRPKARRAIIALSIITFLLLLATAMYAGGYIPSEYTRYAQDRVNEYLSNTGAQT